MSYLVNNDIFVSQGASISFNLQYLDSANNDALLSAQTAEMQIRCEPWSSNVLATANCQFVSNSSSNNTYLTIFIDGSVTQTFDPEFNRISFYDVKVTYPTEEIFLVGGRVIMNPTVSR